MLSRGKSREKLSPPLPPSLTILAQTVLSLVPSYFRASFSRGNVRSCVFAALPFQDPKKAILAHKSHPDAKCKFSALFCSSFARIPCSTLPCVRRKCDPDLFHANHFSYEYDGASQRRHMETKALGNAEREKSG